MADQLTKLRPDRDLQCYFQEPSAVAALSGTSPTGFTVSGCWRQQFDWAVVEWNRDNVFEHPALRNLPDGDLSGVRLSYQETRTNCIPLDSTAYDLVDWSCLRIWGDDQDLPSEVPLAGYATAVSGSYTPATAVMTLQGTPTVDDLVELSWLDDQTNYRFAAGDTLEDAVSVLAQFINSPNIYGQPRAISAAANGAELTLTYTAAPGTNGNRVGVYGGVSGAGTESWSPGWTLFQGGTSPTTWQVNLDFGNLTDKTNQKVTTTDVRKLRWTWAADLQPQNFQRSEFSVVVTNWQVTGNKLTYSVAGPGSRRIEDGAPEVTYVGTWTEDRGNYSGGSSRYTATPGDHLVCGYTASVAHTLYLGTRYLTGLDTEKVEATVQIDSSPPVAVDLKRSGEDVLIRHSLGQFAANVQHTVTVTNTSTAGKELYFDFLEIAVPATGLPSFPAQPTTTLATDWDTYHSLVIAPERTAWLIDTLGFKGRANHYAGAMWFYELVPAGNQLATGTVVFGGTARFTDTTTVTVGGSPITHVNLTSDTPENVAKCFELLINGLSTVWAQANGPTLTIMAKLMGVDGNGISLAAEVTPGIGLPAAGGITATPSGTTLAGGTGSTAAADEAWHTDLNATPRLNRAARDWSQSFFQALKGYGIDMAASFSTELRHGDTSVAAGIAQRYPSGNPCLVNTPAVQTNFSPASAAFWKQVYTDMATVMVQAGVTPYLQFGEVQWWYKPDDTSNGVAVPGMPFYDAYTTSSFQAAYGRAMGVIPDQNAAPGSFVQECAFLPGLIGQFTQSIMDFVRQTYANARFEVLYPLDVNDTALNQLINYPAATWTAANLACLKTENFIYTGDRDLNKARTSIGLPMAKGFPPSQSSHLIGIGDYTTPWDRERRLALGAGLESVVLWALDQLCLIGYGLPLGAGARRAGFMGR